MLALETKQNNKSRGSNQIQNRIKVVQFTLLQMCPKIMQMVVAMQSPQQAHFLEDLKTKLFSSMQHNDADTEPTSIEIQLAIEAILVKFETILAERIIDRLYSRLQEPIPIINTQKQFESQFISSYIKHPDQFIIIQQQLLSTFPHLSLSIGISQLKHRLSLILSSSIARLKQHQTLPQYKAYHQPFRRLVSVNQKRLEMIVESPQAQEVRVTLCKYLESQAVDRRQSIRVVVQVNEFINRKENESIRQALIDSKAKNSIRREEYEFVGKRKKVLVLKQSSNQIMKTTLS